MDTKIAILSIESISPLGVDYDKIWNNYLNSNHYITEESFDDTPSLVSKLNKEELQLIEDLRLSNTKYKNLDETVLLAIIASRQAISKANWTKNDTIGLNIGSSRGATKLFEDYHKNYLEGEKINTLASPTTTLGNISSWVAHDLQTKGPNLSHSITCSTGLHSLLNGIAWLNSGMSDKFMIGASESPLTGFTLAQMKALKIYGTSRKDYPCQALNLNKSKNSMILGTAASIACIEKGESKDALAYIIGYGFSTEPLEHNVSISTNADCLQDSMEMALKNISNSEVDIIITHTPGTIKGDSSELNAIDKIFGSNTPQLTCNKWKIGHTFASSGLLSLQLAVMMLENSEFIPVPYLTYNKPDQIKTILINSVGFGGNAVSILVSK
jgi:3-oxoacyl-(acyl-carrier-protein) synthase